MNLLKEGIMNGKVLPTSLSKKLTINNVTKAYQVYKIALDSLYYNDQNDRIATWLSQYKDVHGDEALKNNKDMDDYNSIIHQFIKESNPEALKKTQKNIQLVGQREPGVVLSDGRIIDGNRRFTCLRNLEAELENKQYFEAVILPYGVDTDAKIIKMLELNLQQGEDVKVDYNPVDKLVGIYNDIIKNKLLTTEEYALSVNKSDKEIEKEVENAELMVDFLKFTNAENKFYICRNLDLAGPLLELQSMTHRIDNTYLKEELKKSVFVNFLMKPNSDMTRYIRKLKKIVNTDYLQQYVTSQNDLNNMVVQLLPEDSKIITDEYIQNNLRTNTELCEKLSNNLNKYVSMATSNETKNRPSKLVTDSYLKLEEIDDRIFNKLDDVQKTELTNALCKLIDKANYLKSKI